MVQDFAGQADVADVDLLLFPECFLQGYLATEQHVHGQAFDVDSAAFAAVLAQLADVRQTLVLGMIERCEGSYFNTALIVSGGRVTGRYRFTQTGGARDATSDIVDSMSIDPKAVKKAPRPYRSAEPKARYVKAVLQMLIGFMAPVGIGTWVFLKIRQDDHVSARLTVRCTVSA